MRSRRLSVFATVACSAIACGTNEAGVLEAEPIVLHGNTPSFGGAIAVSGSMVVIGSSGHRRVETFLRVPQGFEVQDGADLDRFGDVGQNGWFGDVLALDGDRLAVAGIRSIMPAPSMERFVEVLRREDARWITEATFTNKVLGDVGGLSFGYVLALEGEQLAITAATEVYLMTRESDGTWGGQIVPPPPGGFGAALAFVGEQLAIGAPGADGGVGCVYLYDRRNPTEPVDTLRPSGAIGGEGFGERLAASGSRLVVGAPSASAPGDDPFATSRGAIFVFESRASGWVELTAGPLPSLGREDRFGEAIAIHGDRIVIGAPKTSGATGSQSGAVYLGDIDGDGFRVGDRLDGPTDPQAAHLGEAVAAGEMGAFFGAPGAALVEFRAW